MVRHNGPSQDSLNSAAGGNFLDKMPRECLKIIESKPKVRQSRAKAIVAKVGTSSSTPVISSDVGELKDMVKALLLDKKNQPPHENAYRDNIQEYVSQAAAVNYNQETTVSDLRWLLTKSDLPVFLPNRIIKTILIGETISTEVEISTSIISTHLLSIKANLIDLR
uniref:Reverse transcriptase domain-containing protein n=1 Tax=Tanacetum cinerariifolium TaxID=118510 RepID=A0A699S2E0_TANCI|nr:reverse transcriptase domain-containing protein [Tanacetum cinerariifolium]